MCVSIFGIILTGNNFWGYYMPSTISFNLYNSPSIMSIIPILQIGKLKPRAPTSHGKRMEGGFELRSPGSRGHHWTTTLSFHSEHDIHAPQMGLGESCTCGDLKAEEVGVPSLKLQPTVSRSDGIWVWPLFCPFRPPTHTQSPMVAPLKFGQGGRLLSDPQGPLGDIPEIFQNN